MHILTIVEDRLVAVPNRDFSGPANIIMVSNTTGQQQQEQGVRQPDAQENDAKADVLYEKPLSHGAEGTGG